MNPFHPSETPPKRHQLWRDGENQIIAGVCSGIAHYFGFPRQLMRVVAFIALIFMPFFVIVAYFALAWYLPVKREGLYSDDQQQSRARDIHRDPGRTVKQLKRRLQAMERKLNSMEAKITDKHYQLHQKFRQL